MPIYSYRCQNCKNEFDVSQSMTDEPLRQCPKCNGGVVRLIGKDINISFKGPGFYVNDSKKKG